VRFRAVDVFLPGQEELLNPPPAKTEMEGAIVDFSDSGLKPHAFAIVEVADGQTMVVPVEKLKLIKAASVESKEP
jgi:hypothetical protein